MTTAVDDRDTLRGIIEATERAVREQKRDEEAIRRTPPLLRYHDGEYRCHHIGGAEHRGQFSWISNDTGPGQTEHPVDSPVALWIQDTDGRVARGEGRNVHITVDYCGARWSGFMDKFKVEQREDGDSVLVVDWLHDYEHL